MAVVQISKIQVRRGKKNIGTSLPQLASGEMGWAIDSQELFIGNGSVSEGAPYVGNTKIITEHDNILDLALQYQYKRNDSTIQTGPSSTEPIQRTVQERLDDVVTSRSFGTVADGSTDDYAALQRAVDQLYLTAAAKGSINRRITLTLDAGTYYISQPLRVPPFATIQGAGVDKTVIVQHGNFPVVTTVNESSVPGAYETITSTTYLNQPRYINLQGMTLTNLSTGHPALELIAVRNSKFKDLKLVGTWQLLDTDIFADDIGLTMIAKSAQVSTVDNEFNNVSISNFSIAIGSAYDTSANTFSSCTISECSYGAILGGEYVELDDTVKTMSEIDGVEVSGRLYGPQYTKFIETKFIDINRTAIDIQEGISNVSENNSFIRVGNDGGTSASATYAVINFVQSGNLSVNDFFERSLDLTSSPALINTRAYIGEVSGAIKADHKFNTEISIVGNTVSASLLRLTANDSVSHKVHYFYKSTVNEVIRQGTMFVTVDKFNELVHFTDDCSSIGNPTNVNKLSFSATLEDFTVPADGDKETVVIRYTNTASSDTGAYLTYWYETLS